MAIFRRKWPNLDQKWWKIAKREFSAKIQKCYFLVDHKCSFYTKKHSTVWPKNGQNWHFNYFWHDETPWKRSKMAKNGQIFTNQAQAEDIFIKVHYFLAKKQISGGFRAPFGQKSSKTGILTVFNTTWPPENGQNMAKTAKFSQNRHRQRTFSLNFITF